MQREQLKVLLLQIRDDHKVRAEELESFARYSQLNVSQIDVLNVFDGSYMIVWCVCRCWEPYGGHTGIILAV